MTKESGKRRTSETVQNWVAFCFIALGIGLSLVYSLTPYLVVIGLAMSLLLIINRTLSKPPKRFGVLTIVSILCWVYMLLSYILISLSPSTFSALYGDELQGMYTWNLTLIFSGFVGLVSTVIELFRTSKYVR